MDESIVKKSIKYEKYYIHWNYKTNQIVCSCFNGRIVEDTNVSKEIIYNSIKKLGADIYHTLKDKLVVSKKLERNINENNFELDNTLFFDLDLLVLNNFETKKIIYKWLKENGIPYFDMGNLNKEINYDDNVKSNIFFAKNSNSMSYLNTNILYFVSLERYELNIISLINVSILIYLISYIKDIISTVRPSFLKNILLAFPSLYQQYEKANFVYTKKISSDITTYMQKIIICMQYYIKNNFTITDYSEIKITDDIKLPQNKEDIPWIDFNFITQQYYSTNPFFTAFNYMITIFSNTNRLEKTYYCKECNTQLLKKQNLCLNCKIKFGKSLNINKYQKESREKIESELQDLNNSIDRAPTIEKIYYDRWIHNQKYYDNKKRLANLQ